MTLRERLDALDCAPFPDSLMTLGGKYRDLARDAVAEVERLRVALREIALECPMAPECDCFCCIARRALDGGEIGSALLDGGDE